MHRILSLISATALSVTAVSGYTTVGDLKFEIATYSQIDERGAAFRGLIPESTLKGVVLPITVTFGGPDDWFNPVPETLEVKSVIGMKGWDGETFSMPNTVRYILSEAFKDCTNLTDINLSSQLLSIEEEAFMNCTSLPYMIFPDALDGISLRAFSGCTGLSYIHLGAKTRIIYESSFEGCTSLHTATLGQSLEKIGRFCFAKCSSLSKISIPSTVTLMQSYCFQDCSALSEVRLPSNLETIDQGAFSGCYNIKAVYLPAMTPPAARDYGQPFAIFTDEVFSNATLYVPVGTKDRYQCATMWLNSIISRKWILPASKLLRPREPDNLRSLALTIQLSSEQTRSVPHRKSTILKEKRSLPGLSETAPMSLCR